MMNKNNIPASIAELERWQPYIGNKHAGTGWSDLDNQCELDDLPEDQDAIFCMKETSIMVIDCDKIIDQNGKVYPEAKQILKPLIKGRPTYVEFSNSKRGFHYLYDLSDYYDEFDQMTGSGAYNFYLDSAPDAHIEVYFKTTHLFYLTGNKTKNSADYILGGDEAGEVARQVMKLVAEYNSGKATGGKIKPGTMKSDNLDQVREALFSIPCNMLDYYEWFQMCKACYNCGLSFEDFDKWSATDQERYNDGKTTTEEKWTECSKCASRWNGGTIVNKAKEYGFTLAGDQDDNVDYFGDQKKKEKKSKVPKLNVVSASDLAKTKLPEIFYPVDGLICEGLNVIGAPPKSGKSWMMLDVCTSVAGGTKFLNFNTHKSEVVYFALEDGDKFEQERLLKICDADKVPANFHYVFRDVVPLDVGFIDQLEQVREMYPDLKLVVIDTLQFVACKIKNKESAYEKDYRTGQMLKQWGDKHGIAVVVVTHTTKMVHPDDALANINGTNGITGSADAVMVIAKEKRTDRRAVLAVDGRRVRQAEYEILMNWDKCQWEYVGLADPEERERQKQERELEELRSSPAYQAVLYLADHNVDGWEGGAKKLINDALDAGFLILESAKDVGGMLTKYGVQFAQDNVRVHVMKNGTGANSYRIATWKKDNTK